MTTQTDTYIAQALTLARLLNARLDVPKTRPVVTPCSPNPKSSLSKKSSRSG
jgi:hypothetical protein